MTNYEKYSRKILKSMKKRRSKQKFSSHSSTHRPNQIYWTFLINDTINEDEEQPMFYGTEWDAYIKLAKHFPTDWMYYVETAVDTLGTKDVEDLVDFISDWSSDPESCVRIIQLKILE